MKLWDLSVCLDVRSTGAAEREALHDLADMIAVKGKKVLIFEENRTRHMYVVTGDLMNEAEIGNLWKEAFSATEFRADLVPQDVDPDGIAAYFGIDSGEIKRMLHEAYGRFGDEVKVAAKDIVQDIAENRASRECDDKKIVSAMSNMILQTIKLMPSNLTDRERSVGLLEQMTAIYLRFRRETLELQLRDRGGDTTMKDMMIEFIEERFGCENWEDYSDITERMMEGEYAEEFRQFLASRVG